jgi:hypothetical protein
VCVYACVVLYHTTLYYTTLYTILYYTYYTILYHPTLPYPIYYTTLHCTDDGVHVLVVQQEMLQRHGPVQGRDHVHFPVCVCVWGPGGGGGAPRGVGVCTLISVV